MRISNLLLNAASFAPIPSNNENAAATLSPTPKAPTSLAVMPPSLELAVPASHRAARTRGIAPRAAATDLSNPALQPILLTGCPKTDYSGPFAVGGETFMLIVDSGSSTLGVADYNCKSCGVAPVYTPSPSATTHNKTVDSLYGDGSGWTGVVYDDAVFAGTTSVPVSTPVTMNVVGITDQLGFFMPRTCFVGGQGALRNQGIAGIGPQDLSINGTDDFIAKLAAASNTPQAYSVQLCDRDGALWLGGYNPNSMQGPPLYVPMLPINPMKNPYYSVNATDMGIGGATFANWQMLGPTLMDTGTTNVVVPTAAFQNTLALLGQDASFMAAFAPMLKNPSTIMAPLNGATRAQLDASLPPLVVHIAGPNDTQVTMTLAATASYLIPLGGVQGNAVQAYAFGFEDGGKGTPTFSIFGNGAMRALTLVFDAENNRMGFALSKNCPTVLGR